MDDLEEVWGPRGRATVDPGSMRAVPPPRPPATPPPRPTPPAPPTRRLAPGSAAMGPAEIVPAATSTAPRPHLVAAVAGAVAVVVVLVALVAATRPSERPATIATASSPATTIVSAAADLLGRSKATTPAEATTTSIEAPSSTAPPAPAAPSTTPPATASTVPSRTAPASTAGLPPLAQAEDAARQFIDILHRRDCDGLWSMLSRGTQAFLTGSTEPGEPSGRDALCDGLRTEETIPPMRVHGPAEWRGAGAAVPLESEGEVEELDFVGEDGRWVIDLVGDFNAES